MARGYRSFSGPIHDGLAVETAELREQVKRLQAEIGRLAHELELLKPRKNVHPTDFCGMTGTRVPTFLED